MARCFEMAGADSSLRHTWNKFNLVCSAHFSPYWLIVIVVLVNATALYTYEGANSDELPFAEGDELTIVEHSDTDWWKAEQSGVIFIVPAAYLQLAEG
jgi:actin cytoskeleton-regulatory complex protein PAN1